MLIEAEERIEVRETGTTLLEARRATLHSEAGPLLQALNILKVGGTLS